MNPTQILTRKRNLFGFEQGRFRCRERFRYWSSARDCYGSISLLVAIAFALGITPFLVRRNALGETSLEQSWYGFLNAILRWLLLAYCYSYINLSNESLIGYFMRNHLSQISTRVSTQYGVCNPSFPGPKE
ncbi:GM13548 [Drosophila sechellia]|uniref:GM13548 n=1 Tax=Drosophila sechellia TaxID=7238 RepID=B4HY68_DROSE|nr:GM13548 [Drosophila sechellia]